MGKRPAIHLHIRGAFFKSHMSSPSLSHGRLSRIVARKEYRLQTKSTSINSISKTGKHLNSRASGESKLTRATAQDFVQVSGMSNCLILITSK